MTRSRGKAGFWLACLLLIAAAAGVFLWLRSSPELTVSRIIVPVTTKVQEAELEAALSPALHTNLLRLSTAPLEGKLHAIPYVRKAKVHRRFPDALEVTLEEYEPFALVAGPGGTRWLVASDGRVLEQQAVGSDLEEGPVIESLPEVTLEAGDQLPPMFKSALALVGSLGEGSFWTSEHPVAKVVVDTSSRLTMVLRSGAEVRLGDAEELSEKLNAAEEVIRRYLSAGGSLAYVDVQAWRRPVVMPRSE